METSRFRGELDSIPRPAFRRISFSPPSNWEDPVYCSMLIFVISLKQAASRRATAAKQLHENRMRFQFFDAIEVTGCTSRYFDGFSRREYLLNTRRDPLPGELGCYASHRELWKICLEKDQPIIVMEDDFQLEPGFAKVFDQLEALTRAFGFIRLQSAERKRPAHKRIRRPAHSVLNVNGFDVSYLSDVPLCMLAYSISPAAASSLVEASAVLTAPVDKFVQQTWRHETPIFGISPALVGRSGHADFSTIGDRSKKSRDPRLLLSRLLYKGMGEFRRIGFDRRQFRLLRAEGFPRSRFMGRPKPSISHHSRLAISERSSET